jgi:pimeloyl-ACP methyl ester carboxylesterase
VEREVVFRSGQDRLAGTILVPSPRGRHPAVAMLQGSGGEDRGNSGYFASIRDHLVRHGVAVLWYDRPGVGGSSGDWRALTLRDRAEEALAAVRAAAADQSVAPSRVGLYGHSQGGWVAPLAATLSDEVAFVVAVSGPGVTPAQQGLYAVEEGMRAEGWDGARTAEALDLVRRLFAAASRREEFGSIEPLLAAAGSAPWFRSLPKYVPVPDADLWRSATLQDAVTGQVFLDHDPVPVLEAVRCPLLAVFGERDRAVPVRASVEAYRAALARGGNAQTTVIVVPAADHRIRVGTDLAPTFLATVEGWIHAHARKP